MAPFPYRLIMPMWLFPHPMHYILPGQPWTKEISFVFISAQIPSQGQGKLNSSEYGDKGCYFRPFTAAFEWNLIDCNSFKHFIMDKWDGIFIAAFNVLYGHRSTNDVHTCPVSSWFLFSACLSFSGMLLIIPNKCKGPIQRAQLDYHEKK